MTFPESNTPRWAISFLDLLTSLFALALAYLLRFDFKADASLFRSEWVILSKSLLFYILVKVIVFQLFQIQKGIVRHTSTEDMKRILGANLSCSVIFLLAGIFRSMYLDGFFLFPSSVLVMEFFISLMFLIGTRFAVKLLYLESIRHKESKGRVLIYGAGVSGLITKRTIEKSTEVSYDIIGFIDDNEKIKGSRIEGLKVFPASQLEKLIKSEGVTQVIIAIQKPNPQHRKEVVETCLKYKVKVQQVPSSRSWINGEFSTKQINDIKIEDLLGRKPIVLSEDKISSELKGKIILVTGAAGSIGSGLVRQISGYEPKQIVLLDQAESALYDLQNELINDYSFYDFEIIVGDLCNYKRLEKVFATFHPEYIFHAAAYKHVPLMEENPSEAVGTNIRGTKYMVDLALAFNVEKFVMISTDKAVNPTNVMGASKRIAEMYAQSKKGLHTKFITTRFGNVLGSNGSVIPLFKRQIEHGGPVTVTDPKITRYFMTIPEACQLVLEAGTMGSGGEIFVFDMGESVKIVDLAKKMIQLSGLELGKDIVIKFTGLRPGEKLYEELLSNEENTISTYHPQILIARIRDLSEDTLVDIEKLVNLSTGNSDNFEIVGLMKKIVPEFISKNSVYSKLDDHD